MTWEHLIEGVERVGFPIVISFIVIWAIGKAARTFYATFLKKIFDVFIEGLRQAQTLNVQNSESLSKLAHAQETQTVLMKNISDRSDMIQSSMENRVRIEEKLQTILDIINKVKNV
jgi:hypothetical protein